MKYVAARACECFCAGADLAMIREFPHVYVDEAISKPVDRIDCGVCSHLRHSIVYACGIMKQLSACDRPYKAIGQPRQRRLDNVVVIVTIKRLLFFLHQIGSPTPTPTALSQSHWNLFDFFFLHKNAPT